MHDQRVQLRKVVGLQSASPTRHYEISEKGTEDQPGNLRLDGAVVVIIAASQAQPALRKSSPIIAVH
jgi:hypothetical protein